MLHSFYTHHPEAAVRPTLAWQNVLTWCGQKKNKNINRQYFLDERSIPPHLTPFHSLWLRYEKESNYAKWVKTPTFLWYNYRSHISEFCQTDVNNLRSSSSKKKIRFFPFMMITSRMSQFTPFYVLLPLLLVVIINIFCWPLQRLRFTVVSSHVSCRLGPGFCLQTNRPLMLEGSSFHGTQELFVLISSDRPFVLSLLCHCRPHEEIWQQPLPLSPTPCALSWQPAETPAGAPTSSPHPRPLSLSPLFHWHQVNDQHFLVQTLPFQHNQPQARGVESWFYKCLCVIKFMEDLSAQS